MHDPPGRAKPVAVGAVVLLLLAAGYAAMGARNAAYVTGSLNDYLSLTSGAYLTYLGKIPSVDFFSYYGAMLFLPAALGFYFGVGGGAVLAFGQFVVAALLVPAAAIACYRRLSLFASLVFIVYIFLLVIAPMQVGSDWLEQANFIGYYNRHGWAALSIVLLCYLEPRAPTRLTLAVDSAVVAFLLAFMLYNKVNYFGITLAFVAANGIVSRYGLRLALVSVGALIGAIGIVELATGYTTAYLKDVITLVHVMSSGQAVPLNFWHYVGIAQVHAWIITASAIAVLLLCAAGRVRLYDFGFVIGCLLLSVVLLGQATGTSHGFPSAVAIFLVCGELARRTELGRDGGAANPWPKHAASLTILGLMLMFVSGPVLLNMVGLHNYYGRTAPGKVAPLAGLPPGLVGLRVPPPWGPPTFQELVGLDETTQDLLFALRRNSTSQRWLQSGAYLETIIEGAALLRTMPLEGRTAAVLDVANPFTLALGLAPRTFSYPLQHTGHGESFDVGIRPPPERYFREVDYVMDPILPYDQVDSDVLQEAYGGYIKAHYHEAGRSRYWRLWARNTPRQIPQPPDGGKGGDLATTR